MRSHAAMQRHKPMMALLMGRYLEFGGLSLSAPVHPHSIAHVADMCAGQPIMIGINALAIPLSKMGGDGCDGNGNVIHFPQLGDEARAIAHPEDAQ